MYRTPQKSQTPVKETKGNSKSPLKQSRSKLSLSQSKANLYQDPYFCHYKNAMYMGRVKVFQKDGQGILFHDDGTSAIASYEKDMLHGYNLILTPNDCLISAKYNKNRLSEAVYKTQNILFFGRFNSQEQLDGTTTLVKYDSKQIFYANTKKGHILQKTEEKSPTTLSKVFDAGNLIGIIPPEHIKYLNLEIEKSKHMEIIRRGTKVTIGFAKSGLLNGLAIILAYKSEDLESRNFNIQLVERGLYKNQQLNGLGERRFKNGNVYIGQFQNDLFEGTGILKNNVKMNWVSGQFEKGNLIQLGKYNSEGRDHNSFKIMQSIHQRKTSWVNKQVTFTNPALLDREIEKILLFKNNEQMISMEARRQEMLKRIQSNFVSDDVEEQQPSSSRQRGLLQSPLQRYLKTQPPNTSLGAQNNEQSSFDSKKITSSRKDRIFTTNQQQPSFQNQMKMPKHDSYHLKVYPVPVEDSFSSSKSKGQPDLVLSKSYRLPQTKQYPRQHEDSLEKQQDSHKRQSIIDMSSGRLRDSKTLVGPGVQIFTPEKLNVYDQRRNSRSPLGGYSAADLKKRKEDIIESMYRRDLKRSLL